MVEMSSDFELGVNALNSTIPTQLGMLVQMGSLFSVRSNFLFAAIPTQLGKLTNMTSDFTLASNSLSSAIPTGELIRDFAVYPQRVSALPPAMHTSITVHGRATSVCALTHLSIQTLAPTHSIHSLPPNTEFGRMVKMRSGFELFKNSLSSTIPWQLGFTLDQMTRSFLLYSNKLCDDVPDAVSSYSNSFYSGWQVVTGNSIGTICGWESYMDDYRFPTMG